MIQISQARHRYQRQNMDIIEDTQIYKNKNDQGQISSGNMICSKIVNFDRTEAGLTSKWGRISPAV